MFGDLFAQGQVPSGIFSINGMPIPAGFGMQFQNAVRQQREEIPDHATETPAEYSARMARARKDLEDMAKNNADKERIKKQTRAEQQEKGS